MNLRMTIGKQLSFALGTLSVLLLTLAYFSLSAVGDLEGAYKDAADRTFRRTLNASDIAASKSDMLAGQRGYILYTLLKNQETAVAARNLFRTSADKLLNAVNATRQLSPDPDTLQVLNGIDNSVGQWRGIFQEVERNVQSGHLDLAAQVGWQRGAPIYRELESLTHRLAEIETAKLSAGREEATGLAGRSRWIALVLLVLSACVGGGVGLVIMRLNTSLRGVVGELSEGASQLTASASQVSTASQSLAQGASEQAASLEETSASSEEISSMTMRNAENSTVAARNMDQAFSRIEGANQSLTQMIQSMNEINASSDKISRIIQVIDGIAFQTNILALNAAVEAARAGDAGAGFAVVADEVRNLAQRCAQAARDTSALIAESIAKSSEGKNRLAQVTTDVQAITESATQARALVDEVNQASREQAQGIAEVARAITQMQQVTQNSAASAEESASAGEEMRIQSDKLRNVVDRLTEMVGAG